MFPALCRLCAFCSAHASAFFLSKEILFVPQSIDSIKCLVVRILDKTDHGTETRSMGIEKWHGWKSFLISQYHAGLHNARAFSILSIQIQSVYISISRFEIQIYKRCSKVM
jgi:hypothetical protein